MCHFGFFSFSGVHLVCMRSRCEERNPWDVDQFDADLCNSRPVCPVCDVQLCVLDMAPIWPGLRQGRVLGVDEADSQRSTGFPSLNKKLPERLRLTENRATQGYHTTAQLPLMFWNFYKVAPHKGTRWSKVLFRKENGWEAGNHSVELDYTGQVVHATECAPAHEVSHTTSNN